MQPLVSLLLLKCLGNLKAPVHLHATSSAIYPATYILCSQWLLQLIIQSFAHFPQIWWWSSFIKAQHTGCFTSNEIKENYVILLLEITQFWRKIQSAFMLQFFCKNSIGLCHVNAFFIQKFLSKPNLTQKKKKFENL